MEMFWGDTGHAGGNSLGWTEEKPLVPCMNTNADENGTNPAATSLREAIAINTPLQAELIRFDPAVFSGATPATNTISLGNPLADTSAITVSNRLVSVDARDIAAGVTIDDGAATSYRHFNANGGALAFSGLTLANGGGAGFSAAGGVVTMSKLIRLHPG